LTDFLQATQCYIPGGRALLIHHCENPKSNRVNYYLIKSIQWADEVLEKIGVHGVKVVLVIKGALGSEKVGKHGFYGIQQNDRSKLCQANCFVP
jgi:hypothetical protein